MALFQTAILRRQEHFRELSFDKKESSMRRLSVCHSAVWLVASLMIIWSIEWHSIVRVSWGLSKWPLLDEILILAPILFSLVASWAIFYDIQNDARKSLTTVSSFWPCSKRIAFVAIRCRIYFAMSLLPIAIFVFLIRAMIADF